jgi:hypothetical protein
MEQHYKIVPVCGLKWYITKWYSNKAIQVTKWYTVSKRYTVAEQYIVVTVQYSIIMDWLGIKSNLT